jgi:hypothetical protein
VGRRDAARGQSILVNSFKLCLCVQSALGKQEYGEDCDCAVKTIAGHNVRTF